MKIATYNINGIGARLPRLLEWLERESPDVACLQELKAPDQNFPIVAIRAAGYGAIWHGQTSFNGVAILAKGADPVEIRRGLPGDPDDTHSRYIEAEVDGLIVASIYLPNGNPIGTEKFDYKLRWMRRLGARAQEILAEEKPAVLAGDFNVIPEDRDTFSRRAMANDALFQPESQAAFRRIVNQGWTDALRAMNPAEERLYTFWDYTAGAWPRDAGFRIDHLLCSPQATDRLRGAGVDKWARAEEKASDHAPTWIELA